MLADDEPIMRKALLTLTNWHKIGCQVVYTAVNGEDVMNHLEETMPDILVTDIRMPGKDGIEIAKYIWEKKLPIKIIILTAYADFSYAQSAVKYGVVDYVTKTGVFDGLIAAIEKAKTEIEEMQQNNSSKDLQTAQKHVLKSVFDGALYDEDVIREEFARLKIDLKNYMVLLLQFRIGEMRAKKGVKSMYQSLKNFLTMVFGEQLIQVFPVEKDMFAIILSDLLEGEQTLVRLKCNQIIDMMDNFMQLYVYIGVGEKHESFLELKEAYGEAERAIGYSFITEGSELHFYSELNHDEEIYPIEVEQLMDMICVEVEKGNQYVVKRLFQELSQLQKEYHCSDHIIKNSGIYLQGRCRRILADFGKSIYEVTEAKESISHMIYHCRRMDEYEQMMRQILMKTAEVVRLSANRKESLVYECQQYIESNYEKNIMVTDIAREIGASASYLSRIFKEQTGRTIIYTLNQKKLEKAKEYLKNTDMKVYEIADVLGFENTTYFSHFFKKYAGISPKEYKGEWV